MSLPLPNCPCRQRSRAWPTRLAGLAAVAALLAGCAGHPAQRGNDAAVRSFAARGYAAAVQAPVRTLRATWQLAEQPLPWVLSLPERLGTLPVVVYLPGLGESADAGERWRAAWAAAGYAVWSVQPIDGDAHAWSSTLAREGDFRALGQQRFAGAAVGQRLRQLAALVAEGHRRAEAGEAPWRQLDWSRLAVAGFDLGAYTAMAVAGEHVPGAEVHADTRAAAADPPALPPVRAVIALSPFATFANGGFDSRWRDVQVPVLSVTSEADRDLLGLLESTALRDAPFSHMPGPDKYLLHLHGLSHAMLGGGEDRRSSADAAGTRRKAAAADTGGDDGGQRRRGGRRGSGGSGGNASGDGDGQSGRERGEGETDLAAADRQMRTLAGLDVSTAFLDAYLKQDRLAAEWLRDHAPHWLGSAGELLHK